jgi:hypothetical protein
LQNRLHSLFVALALAAIVVVTVLAYAPGLNGVFVFDSVERVVRNESLRISSTASGELLGAAYAAQDRYPQRGLAYVSLALNYYLAGERFDPFIFKLTNLVIHIFNGLLVFALARLIITRWWKLRSIEGRREVSTRVLVLACVAAGMWMLHPIQLTSVLYVVQRMTSLAATCVLIGAIVYVLARVRLEQGRNHSFILMYCSVIGCTAVGFFFKQNAFLLPAFIGVLEFFLFDRQRLAPSCRRKLQLYFGLTLVLPVVAGIAVVLSGAALTASSYEFRDYDMLQRLLTQARVLFFYSSLLAVPNVRRFGLYHDDIAASSGLIDPWTTLAAVLGWTIVVMLIVWGARRRAPWAFALTWFLVGHAVESSILPLELVHEHRNYVPSVGVLIGLAYYAGTLWDNAGRLRALVPSMLVVWLVALALVTQVRADSWRSSAALMASLARSHPGSYRAASGYAFNSIPSNADLSIRFDAFRRAATLNDQVVSPLIEMIKIAVALGIYLDDLERASPSSGVEVGSTRIADMELLADSGHNARLVSALDEEVARRLERQRARTGNIIALVSLVDCSLGGSRECVALRDHATRWHASALSNERLPAHLRAVLELSMAKLYAIAGDNDEAVYHARLAGRSAGDNLAYRLQEAMLYALLERWEELGKVLGEIEARFAVRTQTDPTYRNLRSQYERSRLQ